MASTVNIFFAAFLLAVAASYGTRGLKADGMVEVAKTFPVTRGKKYCMPRPEVSDQVLQANIDWACKSGVDCDPLVNMKEISCADRSLRTKAGYAMNYYYNANGRDESTCDLGQTAMLTLDNPSDGKCVFL